MLTYEQKHAKCRINEEVKKTNTHVFTNMHVVVYCCSICDDDVLFVLTETKISPNLYTPRVLPTIRGGLEGLALMI
jgi:hypothetical protein